MKNDHMAFEVSNMEESLNFYTQKLGLRLLFRDVNMDVEEDYAFLELEGGNLELIQRLDGEPFVRHTLKAPYCPHLALGTDDMARTLKMIEEQHIPIVSGPLEVAGAEKWVYVSDPDNNVVEFIQWLKPIG